MNNYLALGDSITVGYGVASSLSFPSLYTAFLQRHNPTLQLINCGVNGLTSGSLLKMLQANYFLCQLVSQAVLITVTIGSNDWLHCLRNVNGKLNSVELMGMFNHMNNNFAQMGERLRRLNSGAIIKAATLYNPLPAGPYAGYSKEAQEILNNTNTMIVSWAKCYGVNPVYIDREFQGREGLLIAQDNVHPNMMGYRIIAKAFADY